MDKASGETMELAQAVIDKSKKYPDIQFCDVKIGRIISTRIVIQDGKPDRTSFSSSFGAGMRVLANGAWGFACTDMVSAKTLTKLLESAKDMAVASSSKVQDKTFLPEQKPVIAADSSVCEVEPETVPVDEKIRTMLEYERAGYDVAKDSVINSLVSYRDNSISDIICNTFGTQVTRRYVRCSASAMYAVLEGGVREKGIKVYGKMGGYENIRNLTADSFSLEAANNALVAVMAKKAPSGVLPVVFHPTITGTLVHEALGHNSEGDGIWNKESILVDKLGKQIASPLVTISDDATMEGNFGYHNFDSEGTPCRKNVIVEKGVLKEYLHSMETAAKLKAAPNGAGRAQSHHSRPLPRMSNTYMEAGTSTFNDLIASIDKGIYLKEGYMGYVFVEKGQFTCHANLAYKIENGKLGEPLRDVSVSGLILEALQDVEMVADDVEIASPGYCGKGGQSVPVDCGGPHIKIGKMVVGGVGQSNP